jgi:hypothetical protein
MSKEDYKTMASLGESLRGRNEGGQGLLGLAQPDKPASSGTSDHEVKQLVPTSICKSKVS